MSAQTSHPVQVRADGDAWQVEHPTLDDVAEYGAFDAAADVARRIAREQGTRVEFAHPRNPNLRRMRA
jgi:hypothetical protein